MDCSTIDLSSLHRVHWLNAWWEEGLFVYLWLGCLVSNELVKEDVLLWFEVVFLQLPGGTEEYHRNFQDSMSRAKSLFPIQVRSVNGFSQPAQWLRMVHYCKINLLCPVIPHLRLALSKGPNRVDVSPLTWGQEQIQFPKYCVLCFFRILDDGQSPKSQ
jgi:hypothetical protein